ncbi:MAG: hypothetical protein WCZ90_01340 [Melioribacteraceae bacterium]
MAWLKVKSLILLAAITVSVLPSFVLAQTSEPNSNFDNTWLLKNYYERLAKSDSVCSAMNYSDFEIRRIYFNGKENVLNIGSLIEGNRESFVVKNPDELYIAKSAFFRNPFTLSLVTRDAKTFLAFHEIKESNKDTIYYVPLGDKYRSSSGFEHFINDKVITGTYISADQKLRLNFSQDGKLEGFEDYNKFVVHHHTLTGFDIVTFQKKISQNINNNVSGKIIKHKSFHWKKINDDILLYNLSDETPVAEITTLFAKLRKAKSQ